MSTDRIWRPIGAFSAIAYSDSWDGLGFLPDDPNAKWLNCLTGDNIEQSRDAIDVTVKGDYPIRKNYPGWIDFSISTTIRLMKNAATGEYRDDVKFLIEHARQGKPFTIAAIDERKTSKPNGIKIDVIITDNTWTRQLDDGQTYDITMVAAGTDNMPMDIIAGTLTPIDFWDPSADLEGTDIASTDVDISSGDHEYDSLDEMQA